MTADQQVSIVSVVGAVVQLQQTGNLLKGLCPFHAERTPSFVVYSDEGRFMCFGCGEKGDAAAFAELYAQRGAR